MLEISAGDFREQIELAGIQGSDAADMFSICLLGYRAMDLGRKKVQVRLGHCSQSLPSIPLHLKISGTGLCKERGLYPWPVVQSSVLIILT